MKRKPANPPDDSAISTPLGTKHASHRASIDPLLYLTTGMRSPSAAELVKRIATGCDVAAKARALECSPGPIQTAFLKKLLGDLDGKLMPAPPNETTVNAELLYNYVGVYALTPKEYVESLKSMGGVCDRLGGRLYKGLDRQPALNLSLAFQIAGPAFKRFPGAIVCLILLEFSLTQEKERLPGFLDQQLRKWAPLAVAGNAAARYLHHYLVMEEDYDGWVAGHMKRLQMKLGRDCFMVNCGDGSKNRMDGPKMSGNEWMVTWMMAAEIVNFERTARASQIASLWRDGPN